MRLPWKIIEKYELQYLCGQSVRQVPCSALVETTLPYPLYYGVLMATGSTFPLKSMWPFKAKSAMYAPMAAAVVAAV